MDAKDVIARLCTLQSEMHSKIGYDSSADCFCGGSGLWGADGYDGSFSNGYRNDGDVITFIEQSSRLMADDSLKGAINLLQKVRSKLMKLPECPDGVDALLQDACIKLVDKISVQVGGLVSSKQIK